MKFTVSVIIAFTLLLTSCGVKEDKFQRELWMDRGDITYPYRERMVNDLMTNVLRIGMSYHDCTDLLGKAEFHNQSSNTTIGYTVMENYGWDIDPIETKTLYLTFSNDSTLTRFRLEHWER